MVEKKFLGYFSIHSSLGVVKRNYPGSELLLLFYFIGCGKVIYGYTSIVWILRKCLDYAKFARKYYEKEREKFNQMEAKTEEIDYRL